MSSLPGSFGGFLGNAYAVESLRAAIAGGRLPHSLILAGPDGAGKYTLALLLAMALECERQPREHSAAGQQLAGFCGVCRNCTRIASAADLKTLVAAAVEAREDLRETDKKETRVLIQQHPDVLIVPPDPPQLLVKLGQVRQVIANAQYLPGEGPRKLFIFTSGQFMKEAANSLLKILEEPPAYAHLILCAENPGELLPTIRSRCALVRLGALPLDELEALLGARRPEWQPKQRALVARLAQGAAGKALGFELEGYTAARADAMLLLRSAVQSADHTALFKMTETYRAGADGQVKTSALLRTLGLVLEDLMLLIAGTPELVRNVDIRADLERFAGQISFAWIENASRALDQVTSGMRRNLLRNLSLDAFAEQLAEKV
jgi:DNA polymerase-3 subunit delta'